MYERFYHLRERPFALSPDPEYLYPSRVHQDALDYLRYGVESQAGFMVITDEIGSGKTTLLQAVLRTLDGDTTVGRVVNTMLEPRELLETILIDFGIDPGARSKPLLLRDLSQYLVDQRLAGRNVLLVIDEAQNLSLASLEELRMLSNLETERSKLLQIVLVGQPELRDKLASPALEQLRQRITISYHLPPLDAEETGHYINHRLRRAALGTPLEFPRAATDLIHARSRGVPRIINVICDAALVFGYAEDRRTFDEATIGEVIDELETTGVLPKPAALPASPANAPAAASLAAPPAAPSLDPASDELLKDMRVRAGVLDDRERHPRQRERELAEQRRVLAEEYRLLRNRTVAAPSEPSAAVTMPTRFEAAPHGRLWQWVRRIMLGVSPS